MKLAKISLATVVALGAFSSVASATPLEEAIKNVDLSGFARYRYDTKKEKKTVASKTTKSASEATHRFTSKLSFKAALDDNFFGVLGLRYNSRDGSGKTSKDTNTKSEDRTDVDSSFTVSEIYLGYKVGNTTITAGRQTLGTYFTDDLIGTGVKVLNSDVEGLTLAAVAFDDLEHGVNGWGLTSSLHKAFEEAVKEEYLNGKSTTEDKLTDVEKQELKGKIAPVKNAIRQAVLSNNLYGVAAIGSYDPVSFQLWYASLTNIVNVIAADVSASFDVAKDVNMAVQAQYGHSDIDSKLKPVLNDANLYTFQASSKFFGANAALGYVGWKVKEFATGLATLDDKGGFNYAGEQSFDDYTALSDKGSFFYAKAGYSIDKVELGADFVKGSIKDAKGDKDKLTELVGRASYKYSKKLKFSTWYSHLTNKESDGDKTKTSQFRFETKYTF
ncbi:MAG: major outer membrane protein [Campylobacter sp.]